MEDVDQWQKQRDSEREQDDQIRKMMNEQRLTYQEAKKLVEDRQKSLFDF
ncbi:hypothetical protein HN419_00545 [Candidatus Woesearchaeota archaeon]|jgi:hypothetical protein|nr:hypothetical protein [Candidatus Woesearchaeota archaeon]MBT3537515.1 hypothetical protein [Candidatus Woesearchaeota archaeon]MBT4696819.1 hypothetical protein [Candidatus Woesearchaeota archaeon]MBT4717640.1 hypothetical protein [Candidatus Woesearchaeota archaeon]MBT7106175.1 hypothetical protein [Candidatus Woesearchaeota archaeon]